MVRSSWVEVKLGTKNDRKVWDVKMYVSRLKGEALGVGGLNTTCSNRGQHVKGNQGG